MPCTVAAVASAGIFQKFIHQIHVVHNISVFGLSPVKHSMYQDQKAWDITRSNRGSGKPIRKQVKPTQKHRRKLFVLRISEIYQISVHDKS